MNSFNERVNVLTELLNEGHITENEYLDLIDSLRGGSVNEVEGGVNIAGHSLSLSDGSIGHQLDLDYQQEDEWTKEVMNPNKLDDYEKFLTKGFVDNSDNYNEWKDKVREYQEFLDKIDNAKPGDVIPMREDFLHPLHNTFYRVIDKKEVDSATKHFLEQAKLYQEHRGGKYNNSMNGLYKQDVRSGSILHDCSLRVDTGGNVECAMPFKDHPAYNEIRSALESGTITLS